MTIADYIPNDLLERFEFYNYNHALEIITQAFPDEWSEIASCLNQMNITTNDLRLQGGNESNIPKRFSDILRPFGWQEIKITGDLQIKMHPRIENQIGQFSDEVIAEHTIVGYIEGHNIDYVKNRVAFDLEWNSKDQTFDRDLLAMRTFYDCDVISAGIIVTRSDELDDVFKTVYHWDEKANKWKPIKSKYGSSTTLMKKLLPRLASRRNGGCPILAIGIKKKCITDWTEDYIDEHRPRDI